jgi:hypothetical protein
MNDTNDSTTTTRTTTTQHPTRSGQSTTKRAELRHGPRHPDPMVILLRSAEPATEINTAPAGAVPATPAAPDVTPC